MHGEITLLLRLNSSISLSAQVDRVSVRACLTGCPRPDQGFVILYFIARVVNTIPYFMGELGFLKDPGIDPPVPLGGSYFQKN